MTDVDTAAVSDHDRWRSCAFDNLPAPAVVVDETGTIVAVNEAWSLFSRLNGGTPDTTGVGTNYLSVCASSATVDEDAGNVERGLRELLAARTARFEYEYPCDSPREDRWFLLEASRLAGAPGAVIFHVDITGRKDLERTLEMQADVDPLTGLANRRALADFWQEIAAERADPAHPVSVLFLDLDGFKEVNDGLGHATGDLLLERVGARLRRLAREGTDLVARLGGDEFVVILVGPDDEGVEQVVARVRESLAAPYQLGDSVVTVGVSVGVARPAAATTLDTALADADARMYADKSARRPGA